MVPIKTKRLILRELRMTDWKGVHEYASDPEVVHYLPFGPNKAPETKKHVKQTIIEIRKKDRTVYQIAITLKKTGAFIGSCRISIKDTKYGWGSIGYILNRNYWNKGYMTEAVNALLDFGFRKLHLHRITAICRPQNLASRRVMEKAGMRKEAHFKKHIFYKGRWHDSLSFAILEDERKKR
jgi:ribosomal-protein-alanine N-acetyltransferase